MTSLGTNFTNTNLTFDAVASFFGLQIGHTITNVNTSDDLFNSTTTNQNFNATFTTGQVIITILTPSSPPTSRALCNNITDGVSTFFEVIPIVFSILGIVLVLLTITGLIFVIQDPTRMPEFNIDFTNFNFVSMFMVIFVVGLIALAVFVALSAVCTLI